MGAWYFYYFWDCWSDDVGKIHKRCAENSKWLRFGFYLPSISFWCFTFRSRREVMRWALLASSYFCVSSLLSSNFIGEIRRKLFGLRLSASKENRTSSGTRFLKHLSVIRCYPSPVFQWRRKDGKIILREANPKASRCLDPGTKLKNTRGIIMLLGNIFLMARHIFFFYATPPFTPGS